MYTFAYSTFALILSHLVNVNADIYMHNPRGSNSK